MKLIQLSLQNFRCFAEKTFDFPSTNFTVLIGNNATGKTTLLDAMSVALGGFLSAFDEVKKTRHIHLDEARLEKHTTGSFESQFPVEVSCKFEIEAREISWTRSLSGKKSRTSRLSPADIKKYATQLEKKVRDGAEIDLPIFAYYGTGRLWSQKRDRSVDLFESGSRFLGYTDCLEPNSDEKLFTRWFKKWVLIELQEQEQQGVLAAVRNAIVRCLKNVSGGTGEVSVTYNLKSDEVQVKLEDGHVMPIRMLSDGYRNMIAMVADLAYRMSVLNPHLGSEAAQHTQGVVLIDEIDMHLHPKWQRNIVSDLKEIFPRVQFIVTTHSPFIIQSLEPNELIVLDDKLAGDYSHKSIEDVVENAMGIDVPQRSERRKRMFQTAEQYYKLLQELKLHKTNPSMLHELRNKLDELSEPFSNEPAYSAFLRQERLAAELELQGLQEGSDETGR